MVIDVCHPVTQRIFFFTFYFNMYCKQNLLPRYYCDVNANILCVVQPILNIYWPSSVCYFLVDSFRLPYESDVGKNPNIYEMRSVVVEKAIRPTLKKEWVEHEVCSVASSSLYTYSHLYSWFLLVGKYMLNTLTAKDAISRFLYHGTKKNDALLRFSYDMKLILCSFWEWTWSQVLTVKFSY